MRNRPARITQAEIERAIRSSPIFTSTSMTPAFFAARARHSHAKVCGNRCQVRLNRERRAGT